MKKNSRKDKLDLLDKVFNQGDLSGLGDKPKGISGMLLIMNDEGEKRHELNYLGLICEVWNWSDKEVETLKAELNEKYDWLFIIT
jgi:hypothetical protein